eukprot:665242-Rhodomonas_salina.1
MTLTWLQRDAWHSRVMQDRKTKAGHEGGSKRGGLLMQALKQEEGVWGRVEADQETRKTGEWES